MNRLTSDYLTAAELGDLVADIDDMITDQQITVPVTYRQFMSRTFDPAAGTTVPTYSDTATRAIRLSLGVREIVAGAGLYQTGDLVFYLARSIVPAAPEREDRIVADAITYEVIASMTDPISAVWRVVARRVTGTGD